MHKYSFIYITLESVFVRSFNIHFSFVSTMKRLRCMFVDDCAEEDSDAKNDNNNNNDDDGDSEPNSYDQQFINDDLMGDPSDEEQQQDIPDDVEHEPDHDPDSAAEPEHRLLTLDELLDELDRITQVEVSQEQQGIAQLIVTRIQQLIAGRAQDPEVVSRCVAALFNYIEGHKTFDKNPQGLASFRARLTQDYCIPELRYVLSQLINVVSVLEMVCLKRPVEIRKLGLVEARLRAVFQLTEHEQIFANSMSKYWNPLIDPNIRANALTDSQTDKFQQSILAVLRYTALKQYRISGEVIYEPVLIEGVFCRCFKPLTERGDDTKVVTVRDLITRVVPNCSADPQAWLQTVTVQYKTVAAYLCENDAPELPKLQRNFRLYAFRNVIYDIFEDRGTSSCSSLSLAFTVYLPRPPQCIATRTPPHTSAKSRASSSTPTWTSTRTVPGGSFPFHVANGCSTTPISRTTHATS